MNAPGDDPFLDPPTMHAQVREREAAPDSADETRARGGYDAVTAVPRWSPRPGAGAPASAVESEPATQFPEPATQFRGPRDSYGADPATLMRDEAATRFPAARGGPAPARPAESSFSLVAHGRTDPPRDDREDPFSEVMPPARRFSTSPGAHRHGHDVAPPSSSMHPSEGDAYASDHRGRFEHHRAPESRDLDHSSSERAASRGEDDRDLGFRPTEHAPDVDSSGQETHYPQKGQLQPETRDESQLREPHAGYRNDERPDHRDEPQDRREPRVNARRQTAPHKPDSYPPPRAEHRPQVQPMGFSGTGFTGSDVAANRPHFPVGGQSLASSNVDGGAVFSAGSLGSLGAESFGRPPVDPFAHPRLQTPRLGIPFGAPITPAGHRPMMTQRPPQPVPTRIPTHPPQAPVGHQLRMTAPEEARRRSKVGRFAWFVFGSAFGIFFAFFATGFVPSIGPKDDAPPFPPAAQLPIQAPVQAATTALAQPIQAAAVTPTAAATMPGSPQTASAVPVAASALPMASAPAPMAQSSQVRPSVSAPAPPRVQRPAPVARRPSPPAPMRASVTDDEAVPGTRDAKPATSKEKTDLGDLLSAGIAP